jgi:hypothetical protein
MREFCQPSIGRIKVAYSIGVDKKSTRMLKIYPFSKCDYSRNTARGRKGSGTYWLPLTSEGLIWRLATINFEAFQVSDSVVE